MSDKGTQEYFKKLKVATDFCNGNVELAKKMLSGEYKDNLAIKGRFRDEEVKCYGLFLIIINEVLNARLFDDNVIAAYASLWETKPFIEWKFLYSKLEKEADYDNYEMDKTKRLSAVVKKSITPRTVKQIFTLVKRNDILTLTEIFNKLVSRTFNFSNVEVTVDFERVSSIDLEEAISISPLNYTPQSNDEISQKKQKLEKLIQEIKTLEKEYENKIIKAKAEVSPIKGKYIHEIVRGDRIHVTINDNIPLALDIAKKKNVYTPGKMDSFISTVIMNVKTKNGYLIYTGPDNGVIFKVPEKPNIKLKTADEPKKEETSKDVSSQTKATPVQIPPMTPSEDEPSKFKNIVIIAVLLVAVILLVLSIVFLIL